jgi:hypothetical protein
VYSTCSLTSGDEDIPAWGIDVVARSASTLDDVEGVAAVGELRYVEG